MKVNLTRWVSQNGQSAALVATAESNSGDKVWFCKSAEKITFADLDKGALLAVRGLFNKLAKNPLWRPHLLKLGHDMTDEGCWTHDFPALWRQWCAELALALAERMPGHPYQPSQAEIEANFIL